MPRRHIGYMTHKIYRERFLSALGDRGLSITEFCKKVMISRATVYATMNESLVTRGVDSKLAKNMAEVLGIEIEAVFYLSRSDGFMVKLGGK